MDLPIAFGIGGGSYHGGSRRAVIRVAGDIEHDFAAIGRAHGEVFRDIRPASTMVEVRRLVSPDMRVEIEADAITASSRDGSEDD